MNDNTTDAPSMLEAALELAEFGIEVVPLRAKSKARLYKRGDWPETTDVEKLTELYTKFPSLNVGAAMGGPSDIYGVDFDFDGDAGQPAPNAKEVQAILDRMPPGPRVKSGGDPRNYHAYVVAPKGSLPGIKKICNGVTIRGKGHHFAAPPSIHPDTGNRYTWENAGFDFPEIPDWMLDAPAWNPPKDEKTPVNSRHDMLRDTAVRMRKDGETKANTIKRLRERNLKDTECPIDNDNPKSPRYREIEKLVDWAWSTTQPDPTPKGEVEDPFETFEHIPFPLEALGPKLSPMAKFLKRYLQVPTGIIGNSLLATANLCVQEHYDVAMWGGREPVVLFFLSIAESGERKSACDKIAMKAAKDLQRDRWAKFKEDRAAWKLECEVYASKKKKIMSKLSSARGGGDKYYAEKNDLEQLGDEPECPPNPLIITEDPTFEGVQRLFSEGVARLTISSDEGGKLVGGYAMSSDQVLKTVSGLSQLWDGKDTDRVRAGGGSEFYPNRRVSMHLMMQPNVYEKFIESEIVKEQGILARCLVTRPPSNIGVRNQKIRINEKGQEVWDAHNEHVKKLLEPSKKLRLLPKEQCETTLLSFSENALKTLENYSQSNENRCLTDLAPVKSFICKLTAHCVRIAATLCKFNEPEAAVIEEQWVGAAIRICDYYILERLSVDGQSTLTFESKSAQLLYKWAKGRDEITVRQICRSGPRSLRSKKKAEAVIEELTALGGLEVIRNGDGSKTETWRVVRKMESVKTF